VTESGPTLFTGKNSFRKNVESMEFPTMSKRKNTTAPCKKPFHRGFSTPINMNGIGDVVEYNNI